MSIKRFSLLLIGTLFVLHQSRCENIPEDAFLSVPQLIEKYGYPCEHHYVTTDDNYILTLHRIPDGPSPVLPRRGPPLLLVHGLWSTSADFILPGPDAGLGYLLANMGYDVWLANTRGGTYSKNHTIKNPDLFLTTFWDFSYHEKGVHDLPSIIDYILAETGDTHLIHIGISEGSTSFFVMGAEKPQYLSKVKAHISYAPAVFVHHTSLMLARTFIIFETLGIGSAVTSITGHFNIAPGGFVLKMLNWFCNANVFASLICDNVISPVIDSEPGQIDSQLIDTVMGHVPASTSTKQLLHFAQGVRNQNFGKYQQTLKSPYQKYNLANINIPVYVFYSKKDKVVRQVDVEALEHKLPNGFVQKWLLDHFGHVDYCYGKNAKELVFDETISLLNTLTVAIP